MSSLFTQVTLLFAGRERAWDEREVIDSYLGRRGSRFFTSRDIRIYQQQAVISKQLNHAIAELERLQRHRNG